MAANKSCGMQRRIQPLGTSLSSFVRASKCIGSFHAAVEEVILNSIDAGSRSINIYVDLQNCSFEVYDDGSGILPTCLEVSVAEWNSTSKQNGAIEVSDREEAFEDSIYGMKGEALASLRHISNLLIESRARNNSSAARGDMVCIKNMPYNSPVEYYSMDVADHSKLSARWNHTYSTGIHIRNLFHNLPVRRKAMKPDIERFLIKEFIQHMSVLHHNISWTLSECNLSNSIQSDSTNIVLLRLPSQVSVAKRFLHLHGVENMLNMEEISHTSRGFTLQGFMTPPLSEFCSKHCDGQYLYLNSRWLRGSDCLSSAINSIYSRVITVVSGGNLGGMVARHASYNNLASVDNHNSSSSSSKQINTYPFFVLHLTCSTSAYDILSEPDKSVAVFRNEVHALQCIEEVCSAMVRQYYSDQVDTLLPLVPVNPIVRAAMVSTYPTTVSSVQDSSADMFAHEDTHEDDTLPFRSDAALYSIRNSSTSHDNNAYSGPYYTSPPTIKATSTYTHDTHSPYFASHNNHRRIHASTGASTSVLPITTFTTINYSSQNDLFQSAFFNNSSSTPIDDSLLPACTLSASNLFRDSPYVSTKSTARSTEPVRTMPINSSLHYNSPYRPTNNNLSATHLQHSGVKRMITSITEPTMYNSTIHTKEDNSHDTGGGENEGQDYVIPNKKVKYSTVNGSSSFDTIFGPSEAVLSPSTAQTDETSRVSAGSTELYKDVIGRQQSSNVVYSVDDKSYDGEYCVSSVENIMTDIANADQEPDLVFIGSDRNSSNNRGISGDGSDCSSNKEPSAEYDGVSGETQHSNNDPYNDRGSPRIATTNDDDTRNTEYVTSRLATPGYMQHSLRDAVKCGYSTSTAADGTTTIPITNNTTQTTSAAGAPVALPTLPIRTSQPEMSLNKATLQAHLRCIGQCDRRFIVATSCVCDTNGTSNTRDMNRQCCTKCNNTSLLLLLDQHAVDERIQVEALAQAVAQARADFLATTSADSSSYNALTANYATVSSTESIVLSSREVDIVKSKYELLQDWGFTCSVHTPFTSSADQHFDSSRISNNNSTINPTTCTLQLHTVPSIAGEPLHASDFREYLHYIAAHSELPASLLVPPVVSRIVSSRACHSAVRFGDALSTEKCVELCRQLMSTELPFQCAHGRPSMAPLLDLRGLYQFKKRELNGVLSLRVWNL